MTQYVVRGSCGFAGTDICEMLVARTQKEAEVEAQQVIEDWADSCGVVYETDFTEEEVEDGTVEDEACCGMILPSRDDLDVYVEEYDPKTHDSLM